MANDRLTTADAAKLAGVATSTIKRWADQGLIRFTRTAGGHRRYTRAVVERMLHGENKEVSDPAVDVWLECLIRLNRYELESRLMSARANLGCWTQVADLLGKVLIELDRRSIQSGMAQWKYHGVWEGLRRGINRISDGLPMHSDSKVCVLAGVEGDMHSVGLSLAELCLREAGWNPVWVGSRATDAGVLEALNVYDPSAVFLDASHSTVGGPMLNAFASKAGEICQKNGAELYLCGFGAWPTRPGYGTRLNKWNDLSQVATYAERAV